MAIWGHQENVIVTTYLTLHPGELPEVSAKTLQMKFGSDYTYDFLLKKVYYWRKVVN